MVTLVDIAKAVGVSVTTVSSVLNNRGRISPELRERILAVAAEMNYTPNIMAQSLRTKSMNMIGVIAEDLTVFNTPEIVDGIGEYAIERGFSLSILNLRLCHFIGRAYSKIFTYKDEILEIMKKMIRHHFDGIIYIGTHNRDLTGLLERTSIPTVITYSYADVEKTHTKVCCVNYDDEGATYQATKHLVTLGHRHIACVTGLIESTACQARLRGFQRALIEHDIMIYPTDMKVGDWEYESGVQAAQELLSQPKPPTAIVAMNDNMAEGVISAASSAGIVVPLQLSVIGFDNREFGMYRHPTLSTVILPLHDIGMTSAEILIEMIQTKKVPPKRIHNLKCELCLRESTDAAPATD